MKIDPNKTTVIVHSPTVAKYIAGRMNETKLKEIYKIAAKEAIREWLDEVFAKFGKWTAAALGAIIVAGILYGYLYFQGWRLVK